MMEEVTIFGTILSKAGLIERMLDELMNISPFIEPVQRPRFPTPQHRNQRQLRKSRKR